MSEGERPVPVPRPRQSGPTLDKTDLQSKKYENFSLKQPPSSKCQSVYDDLNSQLEHLKVTDTQMPVPAPRTKVVHDKYDENDTKIAKPVNNHHDEMPKPSGPSTTGAIRKAPNIPHVKNKLIDSAKYKRETSPCSEKSQQDFDVLSQSSSTSGKSNSDKFTTPSPSDILRSIGITSKMLRESIGERIGEKTSGAKHKLMKEIRSSKNIIGSWTSDTKSNTTKKLKNVRSKIDNFSLKPNKHKKSYAFDGDDDERPQTMPPGDEELFQTLTFNSPLSNRSCNMENIPKEISNYEIPKSINRRSIGDLPAYEDVVKDTKLPECNTKLTQNMYSMVHKLNNLDKEKESLEKISDSDSSDNDELEANPPPNIPVPELPEAAIYGRIKRLPSSEYENAPMIPLRRPPSIPTKEPKVQLRTESPNFSDRATICDDSSEQRLTLNIFPTPDSNEVDRSESWQYRDSISLNSTVESIESAEPIYANDENERVDRIYGQISEAKTDVLEPAKILNTESDARKRNAMPVTREILDEFDPLSRESFDAFIMNNLNHLSLLETLLSEDTYVTNEEVYSLVSPEEQAEENSSVDSINVPLPPERLDSLQQNINDNSNKQEEAKLAKPTPKQPQRSKNRAIRQESVIIHQNLRLKNSVENLAEPYLAKLDEPSTSGIVDLSKPKASKTSWFSSGEFSSESEKLNKNNFDNNLQQTSMEKVMQSAPQLPKKTKNINININEPYLPSYEESKHDEIVGLGFSEPSPAPISRTKSSIFNFNLKRKQDAKEANMEVKDFIPRPPFSAENQSSADKSIILFKLPSGVIEDILKELNPRFVELKYRQFKAYSDAEFKVLKEHLDLTFLTSVQFLINHKFSDFKTDLGRQIFGFEINLSIPKTYSGNNTGSSYGLIDSKGALAKTQKVTYIYGIHSKIEKCLWMQKIIRSVTNVFPKEYTLDYIRAGWCYMKKSITSVWSGTWLLLSRRKLLFYDFVESRLEILDLRKARCIGLKESDDTTDQLIIEQGPVMFIDCPPYTCYFVMSTPRDTKIWSLVIKDEAHTNGIYLRHQQLTKDNVPVFIDKCINFVYTNGTMSEGIYRKAGSNSNVVKLTAALKKDAFSVQIIRTEYNEHDVATTLKRFFRELPEPIMGKLAVSFLSVSEMKSKTDKIDAYRELLKRLPTVEYETMKKILGHLHFIQTQAEVNRMGPYNLAMVFGPTLMQPQNNENPYNINTSDAEVVRELIVYYKKLYELTEDEIKKEQIMLTVLQKYHSAAENLSDVVKQSGDFKVWVTIDPNPEKNTKQEEKKQVNVILTPVKTVYELCKDLEAQMELPAHQMVLMEVILNGELQRPMHYNEKVLNTVLRWANWPEDDRKTNYLEMRPQTKFHQQVARAMHTLPSMTPNMELKFADRKTKTLKPYVLELADASINVYKINVKVKEIEIPNTIVYLGAEKKRDCQMRWALTLVELSYVKRSRDSPFIGHIIAGNNINDQITWYTSILYSLYESDIVPSAQLVIP